MISQLSLIFLSLFTTICLLFIEHIFSLRFDYLDITNEKGKWFGTYCGGPYRKNATVDVNGNYARLKFHSDEDLQKKGFLLYFSIFPLPG